jgi:protein SCO1/2
LAISATLAAVLACAPRQAEPFEGTNLSASNAAASFALTNQHGQRFGLEDIDSDVVVLTFLYTNCPDVCPITTTQIHTGFQSLGEDAQDVSVVAISVDPEGDTQEAAREFLDRWGMADEWTFLVGTESELRPVWEAYYIYSSIIDRKDEDAPQGSPTAIPQDIGGVDRLRQDALQRQLVTHSAPVYLLDRDRTMRVLFTLPFETASLVHDIRLLLDK